VNNFKNWKGKKKKIRKYKIEEKNVEEIRI